MLLSGKLMREILISNIIYPSLIHRENAFNQNRNGRTFSDIDEGLRNETLTIGLQSELQDTNHSTDPV